MKHAAENSAGKCCIVLPKVLGLLLYVLYLKDFYVLHTTLVKNVELHEQTFKAHIHMAQQEKKKTFLLISEGFSKLSGWIKSI